MNFKHTTFAKGSFVATSFFLWFGVSGYLKMLALFVAKLKNWNKSKNTWKARSLWKSSQGYKQAFVLLSRWNLCARFLFSSLFVPFRGWKWDFCSKLMSCLYGLIFCFSLPLFISSSTLLFFQNLLCTSSRSTPFTQQYFLSPPRQHFIHTAPLSGAAHTIRGFVGRAQSPAWAAPSQISPPPGAAAGLRD